MVVIVIGSGGYVGNAVVVKAPKKDSIIGFTHQMLDITDSRTVERKLSKYSGLITFTVINCTGITNVRKCQENPRRAIEVNIKGAINVAQACKNLGGKLIHMSTNYVFAGLEDRANLVNDLPCPLNVYGMTKYIAEQKVFEILDDVLVVRTAGIFGEGKKDIVTKLIEEKQVIANTEQYTSFTYIDDFIRTLYDIIENEGIKKNIHHIVNSGTATWFDFIQEVSKWKTLTISHVSMGEYYDDSILRPRYAGLEQSIKMRSWQEALREYRGNIDMRIRKRGEMEGGINNAAK